MCIHKRSIFKSLYLRHTFITLFRSQNNLHNNIIKSNTTSFRVKNLSFYFRNIIAQSSIFSTRLRYILFRCLIQYTYIYFVLRDYGRDLSSFATKQRHIDVCCIRSFITLASKQ